MDKLKITDEEIKDLTDLAKVADQADAFEALMSAWGAIVSEKERGQMAFVAREAVAQFIEIIRDADQVDADGICAYLRKQNQVFRKVEQIQNAQLQQKQALADMVKSFTQARRH